MFEKALYFESKNLSRIILMLRVLNKEALAQQVPIRGFSCTLRGPLGRRLLLVTYLENVITYME